MRRIQRDIPEEGWHAKFIASLADSGLAPLTVRTYRHDVIRTVAIDPTFASVGVLAVIVAVRTFLCWSLEVELEGRWPWQARAADQLKRSSGSDE